MIIIFLELYKNFKKNFDEKTLFEEESFSKNVLFGHKNFNNENFDNCFNVAEIKDFEQEIEKVLNKFNFIKGFLEYKKENLSEVLIKLDEEINKINNTNSFKGSSFLQLQDRMLDYTYIFDLEIIHLKNMRKIDESFYKLEEDSKKIEGYFSYPQNDIIIFNIRKPSKVNEIIIESFKNMDVSIYGENIKGETIPLFLNCSTDQKLFINLKEEEFQKILFITNGNLKSYNKNIQIYNKEKSISLNKKNGYIFTKIKNKDLKNILISTDENIKFYVLEEEEFFEAIKDIQENEKNINEKFFIEKNLKEQNNPIIFPTIQNYFYIVEVINKETDKITETKYFGKE